jgi:hypothetical protein
MTHCFLTRFAAPALLLAAVPGAASVHAAQADPYPLEYFALREVMNEVTVSPARGSQGSSAKVNVYNITASTSYTISVWIKCPSSGGTYWVESAYRLGSHSASDFDGNGGAWTMIQKFANDGTNGNGNTWVQYSKTFNSGSNTQISVGFKTGSSGGGGPTVQWDTLRVQ